MLLGIDLDNTIACYDDGFLTLARDMGLVSPSFEGGKKAVRDAVRAGAGGDVAWQQLQARLYGRDIARAQLAKGLDILLERARRRNIPVAVISHKTQYSAFDAETDLRVAAKGWMERNGLFDSHGMGVRPENVFFEATREAKIERIRALGCTHFIDDLGEVFDEPTFPIEVRSYLYAAGYDRIPNGRFRAFRTHHEIADHLFGADPEVAAAALTGARAPRVTAVAIGGNNRLYRVTGHTGNFAMKSYPCPDDDPRDRLGTEFGALSFLKAQGEAAVPEPLAIDRTMHVALYQWIDGDRIAYATTADVDAAVNFVRRLHGYRHATEATTLPLASEACLSTAELLQQIAAREGALTAVAPRDPALAEFLDRARRERSRVAGAAACCRDHELSPEHRTLSPSDFGFHNALRTGDGRLMFLDFEYFGWDDPVKLTADFMLHPGMALDRTARRRFAAAMTDLYAADRDFSARLGQQLPLYALRWCLIVLNEFLPERQARRAVAGAGAGHRADAEARQLAKAEAMLAAVPRIAEDLP